MGDGSAIWLARCRWVWICIDDLVAALLAVAYDTSDTAKYTFALLIHTLLAVAVEDFGVRRKTARWMVWVRCQSWCCDDPRI